MAFNGTEGEIITLAEGAAMTKQWRRSNVNGNAVYYGKNIINQLIGQQGVVGIRFYFAVDSDGKNTLVLVGVDANENDVLSIIADRGVKCPILCGNRNGINSDI